jgi:hypothetical protein
MRVRARQFIKSLYREFRLPVPAVQYVALTRYSGVGGYTINVRDRSRVLASIAWCPQIERRAHVLDGLPAHRANQTVLDALVVDLLERHTYGLTLKECQAVAMLEIAALHEAIANRDWTTARRVWTKLAPLHPMLIKRDPSYANVAEAFSQLEALERPTSASIH